MNVMSGIRAQITKTKLYTPDTLTVDAMKIFMRELPGDAILEIKTEGDGPTLNRLVATYWIGGK